MRNFNEFVNESAENSAYEKGILSGVKDIIMQEEGISEKNFNYINAMNKSFMEYLPTIQNDEYNADLESFKGKRSSFAAEFLYDKYFKGKFTISM